MLWCGRNSSSDALREEAGRAMEIGNDGKPVVETVGGCFTATADPSSDAFWEPDAVPTPGAWLWC